MDNFDTSNLGALPLVAASAPRPSSRAKHRHQHRHRHGRDESARMPQAEEHQGTFYEGTPEQIRAIGAEIAQHHGSAFVVARPIRNGVAAPQPKSGSSDIAHELIGKPIRIGAAPNGESSPSTATFYKTDGPKQVKPIRRKLTTPGF